MADIVKYILVNESTRISIIISLKFILMVQLTIIQFAEVIKIQMLSINSNQ